MVFTRSKTRVHDDDNNTVVMAKDRTDAKLQHVNLDDDVAAIIHNLNLNQLVSRNSTLVSPIANGLNVFEATDRAEETEYVILIGLLDRILTLKRQRNLGQAVIIALTREACERITQKIVKLSESIIQLNVVNLNDDLPLKKLRKQMDSSPDVLIATLPILLLNLQCKNLKLNESLYFLALNTVDSNQTADYEDDVKELSNFLPKHNFQRVIFTSKVVNSMLRTENRLNYVEPAVNDNDDDDSHNTSFTVYFKQEESSNETEEPAIINQAVITRIEASSLRCKSRKKHACHICHKLVKNLSSHLKSHNDERPFECKYCEKTYKKRRSLTIHVRSHTNERPYKCDKCEKTFACLEYLRTHEFSHSNERQFECIVCQKKYKYIQHLSAHRRRFMHNFQS